MLFVTFSNIWIHGTIIDNSKIICKFHTERCMHVIHFSKNNFVYGHPKISALIKVLDLLIHFKHQLAKCFTFVSTIVKSKVIAQLIKWAV